MAAAAPRLSSLWPTIWRQTTEVYNPAIRAAHAAIRIRAYHPTIRRWQQEPATSRYGTANEPPPHLGHGKGSATLTTSQLVEEQGGKALPKIGKALQRDGEAENKARQEDRQEAVEAKKEPATVEGRLASQTSADPLLDAAKEAPSERPPGAPKQPEEKPMESVLEAVPDPLQTRGEQPKEERGADERQDSAGTGLIPLGKAPHIDTPRHVHHFDTYGLVKHLVEGGWEEKQAITIMKSVRLMLADNTDLANDALVSKSNLENEAYLFKAACAELKTEVTSRRRAEQEKMRTERTQLQHEVDILSQRLGQESTHMKDELKGLFDDRKMAVRNEQREMESKLQQLNQRITVSLQADARSDVEGLRWVMTRRVIITLVLVVFMVLGSLKLSSNAARDAEESAKRRVNQRSGGTQTEDFLESGERRGMASEVLVKEGDNPAFVSLG